MMFVLYLFLLWIVADGQKLGKLVNKKCQSSSDCVAKKCCVNGVCIARGKAGSACPSGSTNPVVCTMEAKLCPNGKSVGRIPPNCEFAPCDDSGSSCGPLQRSCPCAGGSYCVPRSAMCKTPDSACPGSSSCGPMQRSCPCAGGSYCVPSTAMCKTPDSACPGSNPCEPNPCPYGQKCTPTPVQCVRAPCPQYSCQPGGHNCGANEEWTDCGSSSCWENTCSTLTWPPTGPCTADCRSGCRCKEGYKRNAAGECVQFCMVMGRPFSTEKGDILVAPILSAPSLDLPLASEFASLNSTGPSLVDLVLSKEQRTQAANYWAKIAMMEHASVASFSRFALELMSVGAPIDLLSAAHQAALDEVRHAKISLDLANQFSETTLSAGAFPLSDKNVEFTFGELNKIATAAALEGCIEETLAAAIVLYQSEHMGDSQHQALLRSVALDEASHAAFAWKAVQWMLNSSPAILQEVSEVFARRAERYVSFPENASASSNLEQLGLLDPVTVEKLQYKTWHEVVAPAAASLGLLPKAQERGSGEISDAIAHAIGACQAPIA